MNLQEITASLAPQQAAQVEALFASHAEQQEQLSELYEKVTTLTQQLDWFRRQYFGAKSERRIVESSCPEQLCLGELLEPDEHPPAEKTTVAEYERTHRKKQIEFVADDSKLKFDERVPVEEVHLACPEVSELPADEYEVIGENITYRLVHRPGLHVVRKYVQQVVKLKKSSEIKKAPLPELVIPGSFADTTFLAGIVIEKLLYYMPLYRQHQRLTAAGIHIDRGTLSKLFHRVAELLEPVYHAQLSSILQSKVVTMDETKVKAGRAKNKMKQGYFWPLYGDNDEIAFLFSSSRGGALIKEQLKDFEGTLLTDGYSVYERYALARCGITHAQCWSHSRRKFVEAEKAQPALVEEVFARIRLLYQIEEKLASEPMERIKKVRGEKSREVVQSIFSLVRETLVANALLPSNPFTKAAHYLLTRQKELTVFLDDPAVPIDSNHLERQIRPIALGRKNWMFCSTEAGARKVGILQSLVSTCKMHGVDPFDYLVDVLPRVSSHSMSKVHMLTPRLWKENLPREPNPQSMA